MPRDSGGTYTLPQPAFTPNTTISSSAVNSDLSDIATALTQSIASTGVTPITSSLQGVVSANPAWSFSGDTNTGFGSAGADTAYIMTGGGQILQATTTQITINGDYLFTGTSNKTITARADLLSFYSFVGLSTDATSTVGPLLGLQRDSASPAANDGLGCVDFLGRNSAAAQQLYARIRGRLDDPVAGSEDGGVSMDLQINGVFQPVFSLSGTGLAILGITSSTTGFKVGANPVATPGKKRVLTQLSSGSGNYTTGAGATTLKIRMRGGDGGGGGTAVGAAGTNGGVGGDTSFNSVVAKGGGGGANTNATTGGAGGTGGTGGAGSADMRIAGQDGFAGGSGTTGVSGTSNASQGYGGPGACGGLGARGGQGALGALTGLNISGGGGGGATGEYVEYIIGSPSGSYAYVVGGAGTAGSAGTSGNAGQAGKAGLIVVEELYN